MDHTRYKYLLRKRAFHWPNFSPDLGSPLLDVLLEPEEGDAVLDLDDFDVGVGLLRLGDLVQAHHQAVAVGAVPGMTRSSQGGMYSFKHAWSSISQSRQGIFKQGYALVI